MENKPLFKIGQTLYSFRLDKDVIVTDVATAFVNEEYRIIYTCRHLEDGFPLECDYEEDLVAVD